MVLIKHHHRLHHEHYYEYPQYNLKDEFVISSAGRPGSVAREVPRVGSACYYPIKAALLIILRRICILVT